MREVKPIRPSFVVALLCATLLLAGCSDQQPTGKPPEPPRSKPQPDLIDPWQVRHNGRTIREWYLRARDKDLIKTDREAAFQELGRAGKPGLMALFELLSASDSELYDPKKWSPNAVQMGFVRWKAAEAFGNLGSVAQVAAPALSNLMLKDPVADVRIVASMALAKIGSRDPEVIKALKDALRGQDIWIWQGAVSALCKVQPLDQESLDLLNNVGNADPYKLGHNDNEWTAVMRARDAVRYCSVKR